ncbi:MAG: methyltransferase [Candidatus Kaiserbacteria bacterium]|nr:methyltransferase [Candidatus Kaiserbacteria bacterium]
MHGIAQFTDTTSIMCMKLILAMVLGGVIGTERSALAGQPAGTRTFSLVSMGAALFVIVANYVDLAYVGIESFDPMHIAAGIVTGVGFIGGGIIVTRGGTTHGITTAAGLWIAAAVGIAVGFGLYAIATFASILALIVFTGMWYIEEHFKHTLASHTRTKDISAPGPHSTEES